MAYEELQKAIAGYYKAVVAKRKAKSGNAKHAKSTTKLDGLNASELKEQVDNVLTRHIAASNPHNDNAADLDMYTKQEFDAKTKGGMSQGLTPVSTYGSLSWMPVAAVGCFTTASHVTTGDGCFLPLQVEDDGTLSFIRNGTDGAVQKACYGYIRDNKAFYTEQPYTLANGKQALFMYQGGQGCLAGKLHDDARGFIAIKDGTLNGLSHQFVLIPQDFLPRLANSEIVLGEDRVFIITLSNAANWMDDSQAPSLQMYSVPITAFDGTLYTPDAISFYRQTSIGGGSGDPSSTTYMVSKKVFSTNMSATECIWRASTNANLEVYNFPWKEKGRVTSISSYDKNANKIRIQIQAPVQWYYNTTAKYDIACVSIEFDVTSTSIAPLGTHVPFTIDGQGNGKGGVLTSGAYSVFSHNGQDSYYVADENTTYTVSVGENIEITQTNVTNQGTLFDRLAKPFGMGSSGAHCEFPRYFGSAIGDKLCTFLPVDLNYAVLTTHNEHAIADHVLVKFNTLSSSSPIKNFTTVEGETNIGYTLEGDRARCIDIGDKPSAGDLKPSISFVKSKDVGYYCGYFTPGVPNTRATQYTNKMVSKDHITIDPSKLEAVMEESLAKVGYSDADRKTYEAIVPAREDVPALIRVFACYHNTGVNITQLHYLKVSSTKGNVESVTLGDVLDSNSVEGNKVFGISESPVDMTGRLGRVSILSTDEGLLIHWTSNHLFSTRPVSSSREGDRRYECRFWINPDKTISDMTSRFYGGNVASEETFTVLPDQGFGAAKGIGYGTVIRFQLLCINKADFQKWKSPTSADAKKRRSYTLTAQRTALTSKIMILDNIPLTFRGRTYTMEPYTAYLETVARSFTNRVFPMSIGYKFPELTMEYYLGSIGNPNTYRSLAIGQIVTDDRGPVSIGLYKPQRLDRTYSVYTSSWTVSGQDELGNLPNTKGDPAEVVKTTW